MTGPGQDRPTTATLNVPLALWDEDLADARDAHRRLLATVGGDEAARRFLPVLAGVVGVVSEAGLGGEVG